MENRSFFLQVFASELLRARACLSERPAGSPIQDCGGAAWEFSE